MGRQSAFATKLPSDLKDALDNVCEQFGLRKNFIVEQALREKLEDLLDTYDLQEAIRESTGFHSWESVKKSLKFNR